MKRKIIILRYDALLMGVGGYEDVSEHKVSRFKGLPEAKKQAENIIKKLLREDKNAKYGYMVVSDDKKEYRTLIEFTTYPTENMQGLQEDV